MSKKVASWLVLLLTMVAAVSLALSVANAKDTKKNGFNVALLNGTNSNAWRLQMEQNMQTVANKYKAQGIIGKYSVFVANNDATTQAQQMQQLINSGVDAILINPVSATSLSPLIDKAVAKGILVMGIDQHISHPKVISVTTDQYAWAKIQAEWLAKQIDKKGNILQFDAIAGAPANDVRHQAYADVLARYPDIKVLKLVNMDWDEGKAKQLMTTLLSAYPNFDAILCQDGAAVGIINALQEAKHPLPKAITSDEWIAYLRLWHDLNQKNPGKPLNAIIVENPPGIGADGLQIVVRLLQGKKLKSGVLTSDPSDKGNKNAILIKPTLVITNANMEEWYEKTKDKPDTYYIDSVLSQKEIDKLFN
ncbi:MAG: substrate-binding domain-containing protein [Firmicutes bacterium]|nr:substrate-binding domain-containing protein [Bacillota bacterium]